MKQIRLALSTLTWISATILATLPVVVAADFGGVLWWTQYIAALTIFAAMIMAIPSLFFERNARPIRHYYLIFILLFWTAYSWLQTVPMFGGLVGTLSNGSSIAYRDWIEPFLGQDRPPSFFPISIDPEQSSHAVAVLAMVVCLVWTTMQVFGSRNKIVMLLNVMAIGAALHAAFGIVRQVYPEIQVFGSTMAVNSFGCFVNRNNAALMMNLGLSASLGLLSWRLAALTGLEVDDNNFEFNDILSLTNDRDSLIGLFSATLCLCGLLVCGSRGGLVALVIGGLLAFGWVRQKRGSKTVPVVAAAVILCVAFLVVPLNLDLKSIDRLGLFEDSKGLTIQNNGRLEHWPASLRAAKAYFPAGSGLGSYAFAYLPYQDVGSGAWFHHADNLWLEVLVEQGIVGLVLVLSVLGIWIRTLQRMTHSVDPIDHGLRVAGWFMLGAVATSQLFDFGLIVPSMLFAVAVCVPATMARVDAAGLNANEREPKMFPTKYAAFVKYGAVGLTVLFGGLGVLHLGSDARLDTLVRNATATLPNISRDATKLERLASDLQSSPRLDHSPTLLDQLSKVQHAQARLAETIAASPSSTSAVQAAYDQSEVTSHRRNWYAAQRAKSGDGDAKPVASVDMPEQLMNQYQSILDSARKSLLSRPLGMESRTWQIYLDFIHHDDVRSSVAIDQLAKIFKGDPLMLERLGTHAAVSGDTQRATRLWHQSLVLAPKHATRILNLIRSNTQVDLLEVLPSNPTVFRSVTRRLLNQGSASTDLLERAATEIDCQDCETKKEKANCHILAADIAYALQDFDKSFDEMRLAIELVPTQIKSHLSYVYRLREQSRRSDALTAARRARILFPEDKRFTRTIESMAAEDLQVLEESADDSAIFDLDESSP